MQKNEESVHPDIPYRYSGYTKSREIIPSSLSLLISRGLVKCIIKKHNILYSSTEMGDALYEQISGVYKIKLVNSITKVHNVLKNTSDIQILKKVSLSMQNWGSEFKYESIFNEFDYE